MGRKFIHDAASRAFAFASLAGVVIASTALTAHSAFAADKPGYSLVKLTSDKGGVGVNPPDSDMLNPWGMSYSPSGPFWVSDNNAGKTTLYNGSGVKQGLIVTIPGGGGQPGNPTGQVFNGDPTSFMLTENGVSGAAAFIFVGEDGAITGWAPSVDFANAIIAVDDSKLAAVYKGVDLFPTANGPLLLAANFRSGRVEVYDKTFTLVNSYRANNLPDDFAPFHIRVLNGIVYVTWAKQDETAHDNLDGPGLGLVTTFDPVAGTFTQFTKREHLNAPWGIALAPADFGKFSNDILVGNFGDGEINAYDPATGDWKGALKSSNGNDVRVHGLWGLDFGNGGAAGPTNWLYFTAGIHHESDGLFGYIVSTGGY